MKLSFSSPALQTPDTHRHPVEGVRPVTRPIPVAPAEQTTWIRLDALHAHVVDITKRYATDEQATYIADKIVLAERMGVPTHGLHYFLGALLPHLKVERINEAPIHTMGSIIISDGDGGVGFWQLHRCLQTASDIARKVGVAMCVMKMPGKVGALRVFCRELMDQGQVVIMAKNTAPTVGLAQTGEPVVGTNPLCIGLPDTNFIYDSSTSTIATNRVRLMNKYGVRAPATIGLDAQLEPTDKPAATVENGGFLLPFGFGPYWFKSFFLGVAIEAFGALAGGNTSHRVGETTGPRLHSREGMIAIVADKSAFPDYDNYLQQVSMLLGELEQHGLKIPGDYDENVEHANVLKVDWENLQLEV